MVKIVVYFDDAISAVIASFPNFGRVNTNLGKIPVKMFLIFFSRNFVTVTYSTRIVY